MHGSGTEQSTVEDALRTLAYRAQLNDLPGVESSPDVAARSLAYSVPQYVNEISPGHVGVTVIDRRPGGNAIDTVYNPPLTRELYDAVADRAKWFTRAYITPGDHNHITFFFETMCMYNAYSQEVRIPGVIRGPDAVQGRLPDGVEPVVPEDTYLVPVHSLPDRYWEQSQKCAHCTVPLLTAESQPWLPRPDTETEAYTCPKCGTDTEGPVGGLSGNYFLHDQSSGGEPQRNRCGPVSNKERYAYVDWLLDVEPGATTDIPADFPIEPTTLSDGTIVDWLSPLEPITDFSETYVPGIRPFITVQPPDHDQPFVIHQSDLRKLTKAIKQQREMNESTEATTVTETP